MGKFLTIVDEHGEVIEELKFSGGYNIQYTNNEDDGRVRSITKLNNARWGNKHWIKNLYYTPIARKLKQKFNEFKRLNVDRILFIEDTDWTPGSAKYSWKAIARNTNKSFYELTGYRWIIETRNFYTDEMTREQ